ncbi:hypothetical protein [Parasphingorhabdus sp.]|uniref:hypothetical protein n=1 Tax=Parasphingorhabdus sp. TaxID=2709688 RepID=UPI003263300B
MTVSLNETLIPESYADCQNFRTSMHAARSGAMVLAAVGCSYWLVGTEHHAR